jgi:hypothetical protein
VDAVTFTSASTVRGFVGALGLMQSGWAIGYAAAVLVAPRDHVRALRRRGPGWRRRVLFHRPRSYSCVDALGRHLFDGGLCRSVLHGSDAVTFCTVVLEQVDAGAFGEPLREKAWRGQQDQGPACREENRSDTSHPPQHPRANDVPRGGHAFKAGVGYLKMPIFGGIFGSPNSSISFFDDPSVIASNYQIFQSLQTYYRFPDADTPSMALLYMPRSITSMYLASPVAMNILWFSVMNISTAHVSE